MLDADVAELADALDLGSSTARCGGSSPFIRTTFLKVFFLMAQVLIIRSQQYPDVVKEIYKAAVELLETNRMSYDEIAVPSILEIPTAISMSIDSSDFESVICLGCIIDTKKEEFIKQIAFRTVYESLNDFGVHYLMPVGNGIIFAKNEKDALKLAKKYGTMAAETAISMLKYKRQINLLEDDRLTLGKKHN